MAKWRPGTTPDVRPAPTLTSISPTERVVGPTDDVVLECTGTNFTPDCSIIFADQDERTDYVSATEVTTIIRGDLFTGPDEVDVRVYVPKAGTTAPLSFTFTLEPESV